MKALLGLERVISNVNLPNAGQISNLPLGTVVETNAVFARDRITPLLAGPLSPEILALTLPHVENQARTLQAALHPDPAPVVEAFLHDPNTRAKCRDRAALEALAADMIADTARFLPEAWHR